MSELLDALQPLTDLIATLDFSQPERCERTLSEAVSDAQLASLRALALQTADLTPKRAGPTLTFGRVAKSTPANHGFTIDAVDMVGAGAAHTHPAGELSLCFALEGSPVFCGRPGPWVVVPPGSSHTPEVTGGRMLIFYWLPGGAMIWDS